MTKSKVLFFSHAVTMAHFARPLKWIEGLDREQYDIYLASHPKFKKFCPSEGVTYVDIDCIEDKRFLETVQRAAPIYDAVTFEKHIAEDLRVMDQIQPDVVIGDFRHSLSVSCRLKKIKYVNLANAYWSPDIQMKYPLPEAPVVRKLGEKPARLMMGVFIPFALKFNFFKMAFMLRKSFRRAGLSFRDYRKVITDGDLTLYCDTPALVPLKKQFGHEKFVGPLVWSMPVDLPKWWGRLNPRKRRVFLALGSSGPADLLPLLLESLSKLDIEVIVALSGRNADVPAYLNIHFTEYLRIEDACQNVDLVICNGGSPMCHAALTYGVPTIGIVSNNDQLLNMAHIEKRGAGRMLRFWSLTEKKITDVVKDVLENPSYKTNSEAISREFESIDVPARLQSALDEMLGPSSRCQSLQKIVMNY